MGKLDKLSYSLFLSFDKENYYYRVNFVLDSILVACSSMSLCRYFIYFFADLLCNPFPKIDRYTVTKIHVARSIPILYLGDIFSCEYVLPSLLSHSVVRESSCSNNLILFSVF